MIKELDYTFTGKGEVKGFTFNQLHKCKNAYLYEVTDGINTHYELFRRKISAKCIDFDRKIYSETDFKEIYPKSKDFGKWAWCYSDIKKAIEKFTELKQES